MGKIYTRVKGGTKWAAYWSPITKQSERESLHTKKHDLAVERLRRLERGEPIIDAVSEKTDPSAVGVPGDSRTLAEALTDYLAGIKKEGTKESYERKGRHLERILGEGTLLHTITKMQLKKYIAQRTGEGRLAPVDEEGDPTRPTKPIHPSTIYKELVVLRQIFKNENEEEKADPELSFDVFPRLKQEYVPRDTWLSMDELEALMNVLPPVRKPWVALAGYAGCRASEVEGADQTSVRHFKNDGFLRVSGTKTTGSWRRLPVAPQLVPYLNQIPVEPWANVRRDLATYCDKAGVQRVSPNDLRRTFASRLVQSGVSLQTVADMLGHGSTRMVELVYGHLSPKTYIDAINQAFGHTEAPKKKKGGSVYAREPLKKKPARGNSPSKKPSKKPVAKAKKVYK